MGEIRDARKLIPRCCDDCYLGSAVDPSAADLREWEEEEVRRERREVREVTEEAEEVDERGPVFLEREASRRACVLLGRGATVGRGVGAGLTVSRLSRGGLLGRREGGVRLEGREEPLAVLLEEELEDVSVSSLVKVPCLTRPGSCLGDLGERGVLREGEVVRPLGREEREELLGLSDLGAGASFLRLVWLCLSWVARVPLDTGGHIQQLFEYLSFLILFNSFLSLPDI